MTEEPAGAGSGREGATSGATWRADRDRGPAARLHAASGDALAAGGGRLVRILEATDRAVVLGAGESEDHIDHAAAARLGVVVVRRRSGGSAVLVRPGDLVWVDVIVPRGDPLWDDDVGRSMWWLGEAWSEALSRVGVGDARPWRGPFQRREWSDRVCFAGLGPGEVVVPGAAGPVKVVGICQRRTRAGALFQCAALLRWDAGALCELLDLPPMERRRAAADVAAWAIGVGADRGPGLLAALLSLLPDGGSGAPGGAGLPPW